MTSEVASGVPRDALTGKFISVRPELVSVCGGAAEAVVVALIDFRTSPEFKSAYVDEVGNSWWPVTIPELSEASGLTHYQARHAIRKALERGLLLTTKHHLRGDNYDRSRSYRVHYSDAQGADLPGQMCPVSGVKSAPSEGADLPLPTFYEEPLEEVEEERASGDAPVVAVIVDPFDEFWAEYPIRKGKKPARLAYEKALKKATPEDILAGVRAYVVSLGPTPDLSKVKWAQGWLNDNRWEDEHTAAAVPAAIANSKQATTLQLMQHYAAEEGGQLDEEGDHRALARGPGR